MPVPLRFGGWLSSLAIRRGVRGRDGGSRGRADRRSAAAHQPGSTGGRFPLQPAARAAERAGRGLMPSENSDLFEFVQDQLTIDSGDFNSPSFAIDLGYALTPRLDIVGGFDLARQSVDSEYRDFVDNNLLPIEQQSTLRQNSFTGHPPLRAGAAGARRRPLRLGADAGPAVCGRGRRHRVLGVQASGRFRGLSGSGGLHRRLRIERRLAQRTRPGRCGRPNLQAAVPRDRGPLRLGFRAS